MPGGLVGFLLRLLIASGVAACATLALGWTWTAIGGGTLPIHGWIALTLGVLGMTGLAWGLMALAFRSDREGWEERVDNSLDPGRDEPRDDR